MRPVAIGPLQLCVGLYCVSLGALMLITPHQFSTSSFLPWQAYLGWWGGLFLLGGCLLFGAALMRIRQPYVLFIHLVAGVALLTLVYIYTVSQAWTAVSSYLVLGVGTAIAPLIVQWRERQGADAYTQTSAEAIATPPFDLFTCLMSLAAVALGLMMIATPEQFQAPIYDAIRPYLVLHGSVFLIGGILLIAVQSWMPHQRALIAFSHIFCGSAFLAFCLTVAVPIWSLTGIAFYGGMGLSIVLLPWLSRLFRQIDPARLQTRLALALIGLSAIPLMLSVAVISEREAYTATQQTLARERMLARNMARYTHTFVTLHQAATVLLAQQLGQEPQEAEAYIPLLNAFQATHPDVRSVLTYNVAGELVARSADSIVPDPLPQPRIFNAVQLAQEPQIAVGPTRLSTTPVFIIGVPLRDITGDFRGVVISVLDSEVVEQMWSESAQIAPGDVYMVDQSGRVIASPNPELVGDYADRSADPPVAAALRDQAVGSLIYDTDSGPRLSSYAPVDDLGWSIIIDRQSGQILSGLRAGQNVTVGILLLVIIVATLMSVWLARTLSIPLTMLTRATRTITEDTDDPPTPLPQSSVHEVATLADQFAELRASLRQRTAERNRAEQRLQLLADAGSALTTSLDAEQTLHQITRLMVPALADWGLIYLRDDDASIRLAAAAHVEPALQTVTEQLYNKYPINADSERGVANVLRTGRPEVMTEIDDALLERGARDAEHLRLLRLIGFHAVLIVPMNARGRTLGVLVLVSAQSKRNYDAEDLALAEDLAHRAALAAANAELYAAERTARHEAEAARTEAEMALGARDQFLSIAAHELRTPLTALLGQAQLLERRLKKYPDLTERDQRALHVVVGQAQRLDQLIATLFDLNRLQTGQITLQCVPCDLVELIQQLVEELQPTLKIHTFALDLPETPVVVACDQLRIEQVLQNLIQNAIKYSPNGGRVGISLTTNAKHAVLQVRDSGIGIPEESLPRLFEPYFRAANAERSVMQGMGVGLGIVKELVQLHGGSVSVLSSEGQGSTFTISLPYADDAVAQQTEAHETV